MSTGKIYFLILAACILILGGTAFYCMSGNYKIYYKISPTKQYYNKQENGMDETALSRYYSCEKVNDGYEISLYNDLSEKIYSEVYPQKPSIRQVKENILEISFRVGSPASYYFYYDIKNGDISIPYFNSMLVGDSDIAYMDQGELVLTNIFDETLFYTKIHRNFTKTADPMSAIIRIELIGEDTIRLIYFEGEDYEEKTEVIAINEQVINEKSDEDMALFDNFKEMDYVLFLETNVGYGVTLDYYKYGIYGEFTKTVGEGEQLYFQLNEKTLNDEKELSADDKNKISVPLTHYEWAHHIGEHIVYMTPNLEWIISRQFTESFIKSYYEKWYHNQNLVREMDGDIERNIQLFVPQTDISNGYEALNAARVQEVNELLNDISNLKFGEWEDKMICFNESGKLLAVGGCKQETASIYNIRDEKCIRIYDISKEKIDILYEFPIPASKIAWQVEISQFVGSEEEGWLVFSVGDSTYTMNYPSGETRKIGEFMFGTSYSPDGKYVAYCTGNDMLFDSWEDMDEEEDHILYQNMRERWDAIAPGWYVEELETGNKTYIPIEIWTADLERSINGGKCMWIEREALLQLLE